MRLSVGVPLAYISPNFPIHGALLLFIVPCFQVFSHTPRYTVMTIRQQSILIGAIVTGVLSTSYFSFINMVCCLGVIIGGAVAVQQYNSRAGASVQTGDGAVLGALAGAGGAILGSIFDLLLRPIGLDSQTVTQGMMQGMMEGMGGEQGMSPEMMQQFQEGGGTMMFLGGLVFSLVLYAIFGAIGGAIGSALFGEQEQL